MAHPSPDTAKTTILIVDDETRMRRVIADYLHIKGYETDEAGDEMCIRDRVISVLNTTSPIASPADRSRSAPMAYPL